MSRSLKAEISWVMGASHFSRHLRVLRLESSAGSNPGAGVRGKRPCYLFICHQNVLELRTPRPRGRLL